jgi:hypothetical protein
MAVQGLVARAARVVTASSEVDLFTDGGVAPEGRTRLRRTATECVARTEAVRAQVIGDRCGQQQKHHHQHRVCGRRAVEGRAGDPPTLQVWLGPALSASVGQLGPSPADAPCGCSARANRCACQSTSKPAESPGVLDDHRPTLPGMRSRCGTSAVRQPIRRGRRGPRPRSRARRLAGRGTARRPRRTRS